MQRERLSRACARAARVVSVACALAAALAPARAGLVTGNYDPPFGTALPGWSYQGSFTVDVPDALLQYAIDNGIDGYAPSAPLLVHTSTTLYQTSNPSNRVTDSGPVLSLGYLVFDRSRRLLVDWNATPAVQPLAAWNAFDFGAGLHHDFDFSWDHLSEGVTLRCTDCGGSSRNAASKDGLVLTVGEARDDGRAVGGFRTVYAEDAAGVVTSTTTYFTVPEPGSLALALLALAALAASGAPVAARSLRNAAVRTA